MTAAPVPASASTAPAPRVHVGKAAWLPAGAVDRGNADPAKELTFEVSLSPRDPAALARFATEVSTPGTPLYHRYLAKGQFARTFGATDATVSSVEAALRAEGLHPVGVSANRLAITVRDSLRTVSRGMRVPFRTFSLPDGRRAFANTAAPLISRDVAGAVQGVLGLDDVARLAPEGLTAAGSTGARTTAALTPQASGTQSCAGADGVATATGPYTAQQLSSAYGLTGLTAAGDEGAGVTVGVFELATYSSSDVSTFESCYGITTPVATIGVNGGTQSATGSAEDELDIEDIASLAPGLTKIDVYEGQNTTTGALQTYSQMINDDVPIISTSWGLCEPAASNTVVQENTLFQQAASQGETILSAVGDSGAADCYNPQSPVLPSFLAVDDPGSQPFVTGVGGTTLTLSGGQWSSEAVWNEGINGGAGGGGISADWTMPAWQSQAPAALNVVNAGSSGAPCGAPSGTYCREVPDVSADADVSTGYVVYYTGSDTGTTGWQQIGGTSGAAPLWAAVVALANASSGCDGPAGFLNPTIYELAGAASTSAGAYAALLHDVTSGNNDFAGAGGYSAGTFYDMASGLGTPVVTTGSASTGLSAALCSAPAVTSLSVGGGTVGGADAGGTSVTVTGAGFSTTTGATTIAFGSHAGTSVSCSSTTSCTVQSPAGTGIVDVRVTVNGLTSRTWSGDHFQYAAAVTGVSPTTGPESGGMTVQVTGTGFSTTRGATTVDFGSGNPATGLTCTSANLCQGTLPAGTGSVDVTATVNGLTSATNPGDVFDYSASPFVTSLSPSSGTISGGNTVTVGGYQLSGGTVSVGSQAASASCSATQCTYTAPAEASAGTQPVTVTTANGTSSARTYTYTRPTPTSTRTGGADVEGTAVAELEARFVPGTNCPGPTTGRGSGGHDVVLATDGGYPDALAASFMAGHLNTGILLTPTASLSSETAAAMSAEGITTVYIVGGPAAVSDAVAAQIESTQATTCGGSAGLTSGGSPQDIQVVRVGGATLYDTAAMIAETFGLSAVGSAAFPGAYGHYDDVGGASSPSATTGATPERTGVVAIGTGFQDAIAASPIGYAAHFPVVLTDPSALSSQALSALQNLQIAQVVVVGGPLALTDPVVEQLQSAGFEVLRVAGHDATDTAQNLALFELTGSQAGLGWAATSNGTIFVTRGDYYSDGLAGSVLSGGDTAPLLLTEDPNTVGPYLTIFLQNAGASPPVPTLIYDVGVFGGIYAVTNATVNSILSDLSG